MYHDSIFFFELYIGYGNTVPQSVMGKALTMVYALIGIPLTSAAMIYVGRVITLAIKLLLVTIEECLRKNTISKLKIKAACVEVFLCLLNLYILSLYQHLTGLRNYSFFDAVYFSFITITTIGFGDIQFDQTYYYNIEQYEIWAIYFIDMGLFLTNFALFASIIDSFASWYMEDGNDDDGKKNKLSDKGENLDNGDKKVTIIEKDLEDLGKKHSNIKNNRIVALNEC